MNTNIEKKEQTPSQQEENQNKDWQGIDKAPGEERGKGENVAKEDLKDKTIDRDMDDDDDEISTPINDIL